jgi:hypothetical protein
MNKRNYIQEGYGDDVTVKHGNTSTPVTRAEFSASTRRKRM